MNLGNIRDSARSKADEQATGFIDNTEALRYINQGLRMIYGKIAQRFEDFFITEGTTGNGGRFSVTAGTQAYALPTSLKKVVRVEARSGSSNSDNDWRKIVRLNMANDRIDTYYPVREGYYQVGFGYFIAGNNIYFRPVPSQAFTVRIWFVPFCTDLSSDSDIPVIPSEYHELISEFAAIQMLAKSGEGIWKERQDSFNLELANLLETIEFRDQSNEQMVISDDGSFDRNWF